MQFGPIRFDSNLPFHLYGLLDALDLVDALHVCHPLVVQEPHDLGLVTSWLQIGYITNL